MQSFKIIERIRKASPDPVKYLRLNRAEFGSTYKIKNYDYNHYYPDINPLIKTASKFYNVKKDLIYIGLGAESVIRDILLLYSLKKKKIVLVLIHLIFLCISIIQNYFLIVKKNI